MQMLYNRAREKKVDGPPLVGRLLLRGERVESHLSDKVVEID